MQTFRKRCAGLSATAGLSCYGSQCRRKSLRTYFSFFLNGCNSTFKRLLDSHQQLKVDEDEDDHDDDDDDDDSGDSSPSDNTKLPRCVVRK